MNRFKDSRFFVIDPDTLALILLDDNHGLILDIQP